MIQVGIDVGAKFIKALVIKDGNVIAKDQIPTGFESKENAAKLFEQVLHKAGISRDEVNSITSTGSGRKVVDFATKSITAVTAASKGIQTCIPKYKQL
jgi:activator of 2-hydroxyglutaryl-CoA dehydratase